jgi:hypothetical protein
MPVNVPSTDLESGDILQQYMLPEYKRVIEANESAVSTLIPKVPEAMFTAKLTSAVHPPPTPGGDVIFNVVDIQSSFNVSSATVVVTGDMIDNDYSHWWHKWVTTINFTSSINSGGFIYPYIYNGKYRGGFEARNYPWNPKSDWVSVSPNYPGNWDSSVPFPIESGNTMNSIGIVYNSTDAKPHFISGIPLNLYIGLIVYGGPA